VKEGYLQEYKMAELLDVLKALDPNDATLWTDDGLPMLDAVKALTGDSKLTRSALNKVALGLTRDTVATYTTAPVDASVATVEEVIVVEEPVQSLSQDEVKAAIAVASAEFEELRNKADSTETELAKLQKQVDELSSQLVKPTPNEEFAEAISHYVAATAKERMERSEKLKKFEELGLSFDDLKELFPQLARV
jgi:polyribonucleotide nucleotidyltransferase